MAGVRDTFNRLYAQNDRSDEFLRDLIAASSDDGERGPDELAASVLAEVVATAALYSSALTHVIEFYLNDLKEKEREEIATLSHINTFESDERLNQFIREALSESSRFYGGNTC